MYRPISAGLMCLGLITLGVTISRGENPSETNVETLDIVNQVALDNEVLFEGINSFDIELNDVANSLEKQLILKIAGDGHESETILIAGAQGELVGPEGAKVRFLTGGSIADPAARDALEKVVANLKREAEEAQKAGRREEADRKMQSIGALEGLLRGGGVGQKILSRPLAGAAALKLSGIDKDKIKLDAALTADKAISEVVEKMKAELASAAAGQSPEVREKIEQKIAELEKSLADRKIEITKIRQAGVPAAPRAPKAPIGPTNINVDVRAEGPRGIRVVKQVEVAQANADAARRSAEFEAQTRRAEALQKAAEALEEAGLADQARGMTEQAQQLRKDAEAGRRVLKAEMEQADKARREVDAAQRAVEAQRRALERRNQQVDVIRTEVQAIPGGPPELQKAIVELREQVQELRKEVGQLRSVLERKQ